MTLAGRLLTLAAIAALVGGAIYVTTPGSQDREQRPGPGRGMRDMGPVPVIAATARQADVPVYFDGVGTTRPLNTVTVRPQVEGRLISVEFKEGQDVKRGDVLARIDPTTYQAQFDQAVARKAQQEALLANARLDLERYARLAEGNNVARQQLDTQKANVAQLEAQVRLEQATIDNARAILEYTTIKAPQSGRAGIRAVDVGNIVRSSDTEGLVVITQLQPIAVMFTLPQQQLAEVNRAFGQDRLTVDAFGGDNRTVVDSGFLEVIDNQVDPTTGTVRLKAQFPNANLQLWPGQFVNVRLLVDTRRDQIVAPTAAVQRGQDGTFVYVVNADDTVAVRPVKVAMQDENRAVIEDGLKAGERIVTTGFARLRAGVRVTVTDAEQAPKAPTAAPEQARPMAQPRVDGLRRSEAQPRRVVQ